MEELSKEKRIELLQSEIDLQLSNRYIMTIRAKVATTLKNAENLKICQEALVQTEMALDALKAEMDILEKE